MVLLKSIKMSMGWQAPSFKLPGVDGQDHSLDNLKGEKGTVIVFTCNHCPYAQAAWPLLIKLAKEYKNKGINFIGINPNDDKQYPQDSFEMMKKYADEWGINFPYLRDESQEVAKAYKAQCTPDIYVFDKHLKLFYHGRINDNWQNPDKVKREDLKEALERLLAGKQPPSDQIPSMGCSIKWK